MPFYTYECTKCNKEFVVEHSMRDRKENCSEVDEVCVLSASLKKKLSDIDVKTSSGKKRVVINKDPKYKVEEHINKSKEDLEAYRKNMDGRIRKAIEGVFDD